MVWVGLGAAAFAGKWIAENKNGRCFFNSMRSNLAKHQMETVGEEPQHDLGRGYRPGRRVQLSYYKKVRPPACGDRAFCRAICFLRPTVKFPVCVSFL